ncbi:MULTISPECIES: hypothetical protein [pseudomallei group]|uniref:hypothetical protein n=1 Tax=pseudomallei group TaxID=111527 RepID=UPI0009B24B81|nr:MULTISPECIES: hypothetical protein [pseudomallei group]AVR06738.1 hypothetical protein A8H31_03780 [Burkholderia thailandensis]MBF3878884.1 hypothetical protein [Burkholderia pseudomallei]MBF3892225.1 hypothetical protein [Burkholderia pseudomallei]MBF4106362.1 hypothetical protein [Burkholderia pseudomallei]MCW0024627.1 hypothetical protein [Burkholderia pseudomallei]
MNELDLFDEMLRLGWTAVSACGYTHPTGWSIGVYRTRDHRVTLPWDGEDIHDEYESPLTAANTTRKLRSTRDAAAIRPRAENVISFSTHPYSAALKIFSGIVSRLSFCDCICRSRRMQPPRIREIVEIRVQTVH